MGPIDGAKGRGRNAGSIVWGAASLLALVHTLPGTAVAQAIDLSHGGPVTVTAAGGIDWNQKDQTVTAHDQARAVRGNATVDADILIAHYRKKAQPPGAAAASASAKSSPVSTSAVSPQPAATATPLKAGDASGATDETGSNEIYRLNAEGHVHIFTQTDQAWGDHAVYDIDTATLILTGHALKLTTPQDVLTARDTMEYWSAKHMAVARGDAVATSNDGRRIVADTLVGYTEDPDAPKPAGGDAPVRKVAAKKPEAGADPAQPGKLQRVEAYGHVIMTTPTEIVTADRGVYLPDTGLARVVGHVHVTRGENQLNGAAAIVNMKTGVATMTQAPGRRVQGLMVPNGTGGGAAPGVDGQAGDSQVKGEASDRLAKTSQAKAGPAKAGLAKAGLAKAGQAAPDKDNTP
jgi:lipopolysaccharide export system protein LptA